MFFRALFMALAMLVGTIAAAQDLNREGIRQLQANLSAMGYVVGSIDGIAGPQTRQAVLAFQAESQSITGVVPNGDLTMDTFFRVEALLQEGFRSRGITGGTAVAPAGPSFDCAKAGNAAERLICRDAGLAALDRQMASMYGRLRQRLTAANRDRMVGDQRVWLRQRNTCGGDLDCLDFAYRSRLDYMAVAYN